MQRKPKGNAGGPEKRKIILIKFKFPALIFAPALSALNCLCSGALCSQEPKLTRSPLSTAYALAHSALNSLSSGALCSQLLMLQRSIVSTAYAPVFLALYRLSYAPAFSTLYRPLCSTALRLYL